MDSFKGHFLVAMPGLVDLNFYQSVICVCEHTEEGAMGIIVNYVHPFLSIKDLFDELKVECIPEVKAQAVHLGGPVHTEEIFMLHGPPFVDDSLVITKKLALTNTMESLKAVAEGKGPAATLISLGCAGWGPGQLESEMAENTWVSCPVSEDVIFAMEAESRWKAALKLLGIDPVLLSDSPGHA